MLRLPSNLQEIAAIAIAAIGGAAVGFERQWSGHASGPEGRFAGVRTFTMLGGLAGIAGWLWTHEGKALAVVLVTGGAALVVAAYVAASFRDVDGTTEVAALVVLATGVLAGIGRLALSSGIVAIAVLLLVEKSRLHALVERLDDTSFRAGVRFAVMAVVVLPLLPSGPFGPWGGIRPRELWLLVLFFSGLGFVGYMARRIVGNRHGYPLAGLLGGLVSSTQVSLSFARMSRDEKGLAAPLAIGVIAACTVMFLRVLFATAVLAPALAKELIPYVVGPVLVGVAAVVLRWRRSTAQESATFPLNPLQFKSALIMAALFQLVLYLLHFVRSNWGSPGITAVGILVGLTDVDALTVSMSKSADTGTLKVTAEALALGMLSNTLLKLTASGMTGRGRFRALTVASLAIMTAVAIASIMVLH